jgi:hypothetical protein
MVFYQKEDMTNYSRPLQLNKVKKKVFAEASEEIEQIKQGSIINKLSTRPNFQQYDSGSPEREEDLSAQPVEQVRRIA